MREREGKKSVLKISIVKAAVASNMVAADVGNGTRSVRLWTPDTIILVLVVFRREREGRGGDCGGTG